MKNVAIILCVAVANHFAVGNPVPEPQPGHPRTHINVYVPYDVHTVHHHHINEVPVLHEVPVIKEIPVLKETIHTVPIVKTVPVPIYKTVAIEKPVFVPIHHEYHDSWLH